MEENKQENIDESSEEKKDKNIDIKKILEKPKKKKRKFLIKWPLTVLVITLILSSLFGLCSKFMLSNAGVTVSIILLIVFLFIATISDMVGVAATSADMEPFNSMSSRKIKGAREALMLIKNADKVASIFCDIIGDICGILSGAVGATLLVQIIGMNAENMVEIFVAVLISAVIAALTVFLKSLGKSIAVNKSNNIIFTLGKIINFFKFKK